MRTACLLVGCLLLLVGAVACVGVALSCLEDGAWGCAVCATAFAVLAVRQARAFHARTVPSPEVLELERRQLHELGTKSARQAGGSTTTTERT